MNTQQSYHELLLLRHGKSSWDSFDSDFERPLTDKGIQHSKRIGLWLQQNNLIPDYIISSPARRTMLTAELLCVTLGIDDNYFHTDSQIYEASCNNLLDVIATCPKKSHRILLIGHNPGLEYLVEYLVSKAVRDQYNEPLILRPTSLAHIQTDSNWNDLQQGCGKLISCTHSKSLATA